MNTQNKKIRILNKSLVFALHENELGLKDIFPENEDEVFGLFMMLGFREKTTGVAFYDIPYDFEILYKGTEGFDKHSDDSPTWIQLLNMKEIKKHLDTPDALPNWTFKYIDRGTVLEESISLREWLKKYVFDDLIEEFETKWLEYDDD